MMRMFIEDFEVDVDKELVNRITYALDDLEHLDSKSTPFSKTIVLPGTANNNNLLGNIFDFNNSNFTFDSAPNVKYNFNAARTAKCRIDVNGMQQIKGVFRLLEIVYDGGQVEYECSVFGELGGFMSKVGNLRLEDLDFSVYNQDWTNANIVASWDNANTGSGVYYPLMDIGQVSTGAYGTAKKDYQYRAFRPALHVREYIDKIITNAGYTWESAFFDTDFFKRLIIPHNSKALTTISTVVLDVTHSAGDQTLTYPDASLDVEFATQPTLGSWTTGDNKIFTYGGASRIDVHLTVNVDVTVNYNDDNLIIRLVKNRGGIETDLQSQVFDYVTAGFPVNYQLIWNVDTDFVNGDELYVRMSRNTSTVLIYEGVVTAANMYMTTASPNPVQLNINEAIIMNDAIPRGVYQKDFFTSILKMFYLMVDEDKYKEKHLVIKTWVDFYNLDPITYEDWSDKVDRSKQIRMKPMSELNARYYELRYKPDNDFYGEGYRKKYNEGYGDMFYDNGFEFSKDTEKVEIIFANTVLLGYAGEEKVVPTVFKKTNDVEERIDHILRIMQAKKVTGVASWSIMNGSTVLSSHTVYPYAGHLDDPDIPNADICFGVPREFFFTLVSGNLSNNLFNTYYSSYMAEITDKDSRLLQAMLKLTDVDIFNIDFAKFKFIDGGLYRLQKIIDYAAGENEVSKTELLRVIYTTY